VVVTFATAWSCSVGARIALVGETTTDSTPLLAETVMAAEPDTPAFAAEVARIVVWPAATPVTSPVALTEAMAELAEDHVTAVFTPEPFTATFAERMIFSPTNSVAWAGETVTAVTVAGGGGVGGVTETSSPQAASATSPPKAINDRVNFCIPFPPSTE